jgi:hypothetical protein
MKPELSVVGIDLAKNIFHLVGMDERGKIILRKRLARGEVMPFMAQEYRKIKRPFPPTARAHPVAHPAPPGTTTRRASTREAAWAWQAVRKLATKSC